jgi:hypothetical protein
MANERIKDVRRGDRLTAEQWNLLAADARIEFQGAHGGARAEGAVMFRRQLKKRTILSAHPAIPQGGVCITTGISLAMNSPPVLACTPMVKLGQRPFFVAEIAAYDLEPTPACDMSFPVLVAYNDTDGMPAKGETWGPVPGGYLVRKWHHGFKVLEDGDPTTTLFLGAYDYAVPWYQGKMDVACGPRETKAVSLYRDDGASGVDLGLNVDALAPFMLAVETIGIGKWVEVQFDSPADRWMISAYQC